MDQMTLEQEQAAQAAKKLADYLASGPLAQSHLPRLHILLNRVAETARLAFEEIEERQDNSDL